MFARTYCSWNWLAYVYIFIFLFIYIQVFQELIFNFMMTNILEVGEGFFLSPAC